LHAEKISEVTVIGLLNSPRFTCPQQAKTGIDPKLRAYSKSVLANGIGWAEKWIQTGLIAARTVWYSGRAA
jgi:hypothetical protein